ncbi:MAG TPA: hypothetical protein VHW02_07390 [Rhizomicrobium sp.]|nr:hypothetical protein [Rhizomicrobium sp.]
MSLTEFKSTYSEAQCFEIGPRVSCELTAPPADSCPTPTYICQSVRYIFTNDILVGFTASYESSAWHALVEQAEKAFGASRTTSVPETPPLTISSETFIWNLTPDTLSFAQFTGTDLNGAPIADPFLIAYGQPETEKSPTCDSGCDSSEAEPEPDESSTPAQSGSWPDSQQLDDPSSSETAGSDAPQ